MTHNPDNLQAQLRLQDRDRFMCTLLAPVDARVHLLALLGWSLELSKVAEHVSEEMVGLIRQTWWREVLEEIAEGKPPRPQPVVQAMAEAMKAYDLSLEPFERMVHARGNDLRKAPFETLEDVEAYAANTSGALMEVWTTVSGENREAANKIGTAWGLVGTLRATHALAHQDKLRFPTKLLDEAGIKQDNVLLGKFSPELGVIVKQMVELAEANLAAAGKGRGSIYSLAMITRDYLSRIKKRDYNPFDPRIENGRSIRALKLMFA